MNEKMSLNDISFDVWVYAQAARDALHAEKHTECEAWLEKIRQEIAEYQKGVA